IVTVHVECTCFLLRQLYRCLLSLLSCFNDPATTEIYTLSLHDALPIFLVGCVDRVGRSNRLPSQIDSIGSVSKAWMPHFITTCRSEEHTSELQSRENLVCRLLLEKKKKIYK